jgi:hypothetical protein
MRIDKDSRECRASNFVASGHAFTRHLCLSHPTWRMVSSHFRGESSPQWLRLQRGNDSISPYSAVKRYNARGDTTLHDAPPLRSAGRVSSGAARRYHLVAETPLDLGAMLTADRP